MSNGSISISFQCKTCGTKLTWPDDAQDATDVLCSKCGASAGNYGSLKRQAMDAAKDMVRDAMRKISRRR
ncbi:ECs_2282 family putative zinc-binding protein [Burkholderia gladioli]|uniref:ECs_2282 family putative zinc-binding protein n=1 Tax=Burkholderia gladioli TaxID=28095 RepID=UPI003C7C280F